MSVTTGNRTKDKVIMHGDKILLALLPFWTSLIPPMGISCIKSFLQQYGYDVKAVDANVRSEFGEVNNDYLKTLAGFVPGNKRGNFYNIATDIVNKHMMAHLNYQDRREYMELIKLVVFQTFFCELNDSQVIQLDQMIAEFYRRFEKYFIDLLKQEEPAVLGLSMYSATAPASLFAFRLTKERFPHIKTVMGGGIFTGELDIDSPNFKFFLEKTPYIDKIIVGEGEKLFLKYLQGKLPESQVVYTLKDIDHETLNLDTVEIPDFTDFDLRYYPNLAAYTSRSCPFQCTFCSEVVIWGKYRKKTAKLVVEELNKLSKKHNYQLFLMSDSLLNPIITDLANEFINAGISIYWDGYLRADKPACNIENTMLWRRGGFYRARLGLESGSPHILQAMGKKIMPDQIKAAVSSLAYAGIKTTTYWVIGYPGETEEDFCQTLALIEELKDDIYEADCNPFTYLLTGQVNSHQWADENRSISLYPETARDMLMFQTWVLGGEPSRERTFQRLNRFVQHCNNLGIPNPYMLQEIQKADERWKKLHKNAVPSIVEFMPNKDNKSHTIDENKNIKKIVFARNIPVKINEGAWGF
ncbi:MAG: radical SAM protein [Candidatus Aminicenantes bacterium]|jgi:radical SAM superfamily enzyme YgiQ (UPF0313 family)